MKYILFAIFNLSVLTSYAQIGVRAGANLSSGIDKDMRMTPKIGFHAGTDYDIALSGKFFLQPQLLFVYENYGLESDISSSMTIKENTKKYALQLPLLVSFRHAVGAGGKLHLDLGPYAQFGLFGKTYREEWRGGLKTDFPAENTYSAASDVFGAGIMAGVGYSVGKASYTTHFKQGLNFDRSGALPITLMLSVGYKIGK